LRWAAHGAATPLLLLGLALPVGNGASLLTPDSGAGLFAAPNTSRIRPMSAKPSDGRRTDFYVLPNDEDPPARKLGAANRSVPAVAARTGSRISFWPVVAAAGLVLLAAALAVAVFLWHRRRQGALPHAVMALRQTHGKVRVEPQPAAQPKEQEMPTRRAA
jgi:hypothetical protein